ncbi:MAG: DUF2911 domain-containing protein [Acidobacteria bacterium]|nr:DUF2911 domain-containing protein [Acidobacteriota bacterium]MCI0620330.1 DUF2911 domain-containing protein [Acidobacteriota bacterium]MCI0723175.1 DUF2911 domain-containing protein [Acidobacteriota bacterium]
MNGFMRKAAGLLLFTLAASSFALSQRNPRATSKLDVNGKFVMIEYGRPSLKGRDILALIEPGKVWRMGADKSTTFTSDGRLSFGKVAVPEGTYSLWLKKVGERSFDLIFNKQTGQWGTQYGSIDDVASVPMAFSEGGEAVEVFTLSLVRGAKTNAGELALQWGKAVLKAPFTVK